MQSQGTDPKCQVSQQSFKKRKLYQLPYSSSGGIPSSSSVHWEASGQGKWPYTGEMSLSYGLFNAQKNCIDFYTVVFISSRKYKVCMRETNISDLMNSIYRENRLN